MSFSQLPAVKKDTKNCAPVKNFGAAYFVMTLAKALSLAIAFAGVFGKDHAEQLDFF